MLGVTSYQEALRALGALFSPAADLVIQEHTAPRRVEVAGTEGTRRFTPADLVAAVLASHGRRGQRRAAGPVSDLLRSVGLALDELNASRLDTLELTKDSAQVRFTDRDGRPHELSYSGDEMEALRQAAVARRKGDPLRRVLILQSGVGSAVPLVEMLAAEFAVQAVPPVYATAVAQAAELPDLVLAQASSATLEAIRTLRGRENSAHIPIVVLVPRQTEFHSADAFAAGADDVLREPVQRAQLRARIRTMLLRHR